MKYFETKFQENSQFINPKFQENTQSIDPKFQENEQNISPNFGETQLVHDGVNGATFIPNVSEDGVISWTNNGDLPNPKPVSIKGNAGEPGEKGDRGEDGYTPIKNVDYFDGKDGEDGKTPYIQDNYWYLDGQNLGVKAKGENGTSITIISSHISNESGGISTIRFSDGTELTVRNGKDGQRGEDGTDGVDGVSATHSWNGTILTVTSASGTSSVDLKGEKGDKGDGFKIERTFNSVIAMNAGFYSDNVPLHGFVLIETGNVNDEDNAKLFVKGVAQYHYLTDLSGAQGIKGEDGNDGKDGRGISSIAKTATNGLIDTYTITYTDKTQSTFNVVNGEKGTDGKSVGISSIDETTESGGTNTITFTDGKSISIKNGLKGEIGAPGKDGQDGYTPIKGVDYFDGKVGDKGDPGVDGKTAYEFAKDGGYTGTEEEFSAKLAEQFYVSPEMYKNLTDAVDKKLDANGVDTYSSESGEDVSLSVANGVVLESSQDVGTIRIKGGLEETQITATSIAGIPYGSIVKNTDMASGSKLGLVKVYSGYGVEIGTSGTLFTQKASNAEIDAKKHNYNVIVPSNLEYAVKSVAYDKGETDKAVGDAIDELSKTVNTALNEKLDAGGLNHNYDENNEIVELGIGNGVTVVSDKGEGQVTLTSGDTQTVIDANRIAGIEYQDILTVAQKGASNGIAELDKDGKIISSQLPSYVDDVIEGYYVAQNDEFYEDENHTIIIPVENGKIYVDLHENRTYRYSGTQYTEISPSIALGTTSSTAFRGDYGQAAYTHSQKTSGNPHNVSKTDVGLGNVENVKQYSASNPPPYPVTSVNNKTGAVTLNAEDLGAYTKDETNELVTTAVDDLAEGFGEVILGMIGNDIPEDGSIPTIRGIANDEVSKLPLVGTTEDITPSQVADALEDGRPLSITHTDSTFGTGVFNNFAKADSFGVIISSAIVFFNNTYIILELLGDTSSNGWNVLSTTIAESEKMALALDGKVPTTRTVNGKALSSDITLSASDVKALPDTTVLADLTGDATHRTVTDAEKSSWNDKLDSDGLTHTYSDEDVGLNVGAGVELLSARDEGYITLKGNDGNSSIGINAQSIAGIDYTDIITTAHKGVASGVAELDDNGKVPSSQLPAYVDDVLEGYYNADEDKFYSVESPNENPYDEDKGKIYVDVSTNKTYRYSGSQYVEISASLALGETASTAYRGDRGKTAYDHSQTTTGNPHRVTKSDVGLGNVNNTSDANKPVSTAQAAAILDAKTYDVSGKAFQRVYSSLIPYGTSIPANANLNTVAYMKVGNYYCSRNADAETLINSPTTTAFMMTVSSPLSTTIDNESGTWVYRLRKLQVYTGAEYVQYCYTNGTAGNWIYGTWYLSIKSNNTASTTSAGLMSAADKTKLNGIDTQISNAVATKADKKAGVFYIEGDGSTDGVWTGTCSDITAYYEGLLIAYKTNIAGISDGTTLNINGLGAVSVVRNTTTAVTTHYGVGSVLMLVYTTDSSGTSYWKISDYDSDTKTRSSNNAGKKMFIIGATAQSTSGQTTYSNSNCYIGTNNRLYSGGELVSNVADIKAIIDEKTNSVKNYGAVGDGTTDDSTAFQNALAANTTVFVPNGTYLLSKTITIGANSQLELSQGTVLNFTQTTGICIKVGMLSSLKGNHATINVPYEFAGTVIFADSSELTSSDVNSIPPWSKWTPQWKSGRYVTDINICKADSRGFHYAVNATDCKGNAVYLSSDGAADTQHYMWGIHYSGLRIAGAFAYGIYAVNFNEGWLHEMRIDAFIDACETGVCLEDCNNVYISAIVQPRRAYSTDGVYSPYAKNGIKLTNSANVDLSGSRVWDWNSQITLYSATNQYQHIAMYGDCRGAIINDFSYHSYGDTRNRIYTDTANNLKTVTILQEPIDRWFKIKDGKPYYNDGDEDHKLITKEDLESHFITDTIPTFSNLLPIATDTDGSIFNGTGYGDGYLSPGKGIFTSSSSFKATGFIPIAKGETIYFKNLFLNNAISQGSSYTGFHLYKSDKTWSSQLTGQNMKNSGTSGTYLTFTATTDGFTVTTKDAVATAGLTYMRVSFMKAEFGANPIISKTPIGYKSQGFLADDIYIKSQNLMLLSPSGKEFKLSVDENGNLITTAV